MSMSTLPMDYKSCGVQSTQKCDQSMMKHPCDKQLLSIIYPHMNEGL